MQKDRPKGVFLRHNAFFCVCACRHGQPQRMPAEAENALSLQAPDYNNKVNTDKTTRYLSSSLRRKVSAVAR